jgi:iron uptake system EfeUOB component EfeO/EfeM
MIEAAEVAEAAEEAAEEEASEVVEAVTEVPIDHKLMEVIEEVDITEEIRIEKSMKKKMMEWDTLNQSTIRSQEETRKRAWHSPVRTIPSSECESRGSLTPVLFSN